jgi:hypothetical protein
MKAIISKKGFLWLSRVGGERVMLCPYTKDTRCGDWCPLFSEPTKSMIEDNNDIHISLCNTILVLNELIDERKEA